MRTPDTIEELDKWQQIARHQLEPTSTAEIVADVMIQARDEIMELREMLPSLMQVSDMIRKAYNEALEDAARCCENQGMSGACREIRRMKDKSI